MKELTKEAKKALDDKSPLVGHLRFQPQGFPRDAWRLQNVARPGEWDREHWSYDKSQVVRRPSKARPKRTALEQAQELLKKMLEGKK